MRDRKKVLGLVYRGYKFYVLVSKDLHFSKLFAKLVSFLTKPHSTPQVGDLKRLLEAYSQWHCRIFPSLTFSEFIVKVEKVGATKRVRVRGSGLHQRAIAVAV